MDLMDSVSGRRRLPLGRIVLATAVAGGLDLAYAFAINASVGVNPLQVLQFIASGLLGTAAFTGGGAAAALGAVCHFALMAVFASLVWAIGRLSPCLTRSRPGVGALMGGALFAGMWWVVVPLSGTPAIGSMGMVRWLTELAMHVLVVGPVVASVVLDSPGRASSEASQG